MFKFQKESFIMLLMSLLLLVLRSTIKINWINCELNLIWRDLVTVNVIVHNL